jgi:FkbM family methyltransferase
MDDAAINELQRRIALARLPRYSKLAAAPWRTAQSVLLSRLCRTFGFAVHKRARMFWGDSMEVVIPEEVGTFIHRFGFYEADLSTLFARYLKPNMTVFDIGAHYGYMTLLCASLVGPVGRVHAFEPTPSTFAMLKRNTAAKPNVVLNQVAVYSEPGELKLLDFGLVFAAFNSAAGGRLDADTQERIAPQEFVARAVTIDGYVESSGAKPDLIKIDAEKAELAILTGAERTLRTQRPVIVMEVGDEPDTPPERASARTVRHLIDRDYHIHRIEGRELVRQEPRDHYEPDNLVFVPADRQLTA